MHSVMRGTEIRLGAYHTSRPSAFRNGRMLFSERVLPSPALYFRAEAPSAAEFPHPPPPTHPTSAKRPRSPEAFRTGRLESSRPIRKMVPCTPLLNDGQTRHDCPKRAGVGRPGHAKETQTPPLLCLP